MSAQFSLTIHGVPQAFDRLEPILTQAGVSSERVEPIQFSVQPPHSTVLIVTGIALKALVECFRIYVRETKKRITLVKGNDFTQIENCTDQQIESVLRENPDIFIDESKTRKSLTQTKPKVIPTITTEIEESVGISLRSLSQLYLLDSLKGFGPQKFKALHIASKSPGDVIANPQLLPIPGATGERFRSELKAISEESHLLCQDRATNQIYTAFKHKAKIITYSHPAYPKNVYESNNPIAILYVHGKIDILKERQIVACVGSRNTHSPYSGLLASFVTTAIRQNFAVVSGFALGADTLAHKTAVDAGGRTICVMPGGLDRPFPPENKTLWERFLESSGAVFVSEFPFGMGASALNLRKRNKLIVAFCNAALIAQSAKDGGAMNAYRFAREQHKSVGTFSPNNLPETSGNQLIITDREAKDATFSITDDVPAYEQWLRALSSSI